MTPTPPPDALKVSLDLEQKGMAFYQRTAQAATEPLTRKLFETLAQDEQKHMDRIQAIFAATQKGAQWSAPDEHRQQDFEKRIHAFFQEHKQNIRPETSNVEAYVFAMNLERTGIEIYTKFSQEAKLPAEQQFFKALITEENGHLEAIMNVHFFMTQPGDWLEEDESKRWNWMNL